MRDVNSTRKIDNAHSPFQRARGKLIAQIFAPARNGHIHPRDRICCGFCGPQTLGITRLTALGEDSQLVGRVLQFIEPL